MGFVRLTASGVLRRYIQAAFPATRWVISVILAHKALAIMSVIALEEIGVPVPLPGDITIMLAGHLVARHRLGLASAFLAIVIGSMIGSTVLYTITRRFGKPFLQRYGPYIHMKPGRLDQVESWFQRWGPLVIVVGRHVPGLRMVISACAGVFGIRYSVFLASVTVSASLWAAIFLAIGIRLDRHIGPYLEITPAHMLPSILFIGGSIGYALLLRRRARREAAVSRRAAAGDGTEARKEAAKAREAREARV